MNRRVAAQVSLWLIVLALVPGVGRPARTLAAGPGNAGEFILRAPADRIDAIASHHGLTVVRRLEGHPDIYLVRLNQLPDPTQLAVDSDAPQRIRNELLSDPDVAQVEINGSVLIAETQAVPHLNESTVAILDSFPERAPAAYFGTTVWGPYVRQPATAIIRLSEAQQLATGSGVVVAIIDTGVDPRHSALQGVLVPGYDFTRDAAGPASEWPDLDESIVGILDQTSTSVLDPNAPVSLNESTVAILDQATAYRLDISRLPPAFGHGTMVAGLVHVVAPSASIMPLKAFTADGTSNLFDIERAIYYAADHGAKVINMSFSMSTASTEITQAVDYASARGVICLASAGNSGRSAVVFPAGFRNVMGIGSTTTRDERSSFSNYGDHLVKFAAPGERLITLYPGGRYAAVSGTSFSTALVAGGTGLLAELEPTVDHRTAGRDLDDGAAKRPASEMGEGRIDLFETLRRRSATTTSPPAPRDHRAPTVTLVNPVQTATVRGTISLVASASDDVGVASVQFTLDGVNLAGPSTTAPYELLWNSLGVANGTHVLAAVARDAAGNEATAASVTVIVTNDTTPPTVALTNPAAGATVKGTITLSAAASDDVQVAGVRFTVDGIDLGAEDTVAPYERAWNSATSVNGVHVLAAVARDTSGNQRTASLVVTVSNDTILPN